MIVRVFYYSSCSSEWERFGWGRGGGHGFVQAVEHGLVLLAARCSGHIGYVVLGSGCTQGRTRCALGSATYHSSRFLYLPEYVGEKYGIKCVLDLVEGKVYVFKGMGGGFRFL